MIYISRIVKKWRENLTASTDDDAKNTCVSFNDGAKLLLKSISLQYNSERDAGREKFSSLLAQLNQEKIKEKRNFTPNRVVESVEEKKKTPVVVNEDISSAIEPKPESKIDFVLPLPPTEIKPLAELEQEESPLEEEFEEVANDDSDDFTSGLFESQPQRPERKRRARREYPEQKKAPVVEDRPPKVEHRQENTRQENTRQENTRQENTRQENTRVESPSTSANANAPAEDAEVESVESLVKSMRTSDKGGRSDRPHRRRNHQNRDNRRGDNKDKKGNRHKWV